MTDVKTKPIVIPKIEPKKIDNPIIPVPYQQPKPKA